MPSDGPTKIDSLERLTQLLETGRISEDEFAHLKSELIESNAAVETVEEATPIQPEGTPHAEDQDTGQPASATPGIYLAALWMGGTSVFLGSTFGLVSWTTIGVSIYALATTKAKRRRWMPWVGLALGVIYAIANAAVYGHLSGF